MRNKTYALSAERAQRLEKKALQLSVEKGSFVKESELISYLVDKYASKLKIKEGKPYIDD